MSRISRAQQQVLETIIAVKLAAAPQGAVERFLAALDGAIAELNERSKAGIWQRCTRCGLPSVFGAKIRGKGWVCRHCINQG